MFPMASVVVMIWQLDLHQPIYIFSMPITTKM